MMDTDKTDDTPEQVEQQAFLARLGEGETSPIAAESDKSPLEELAPAEDDVPPEPAKFLGDFTEEQVLDQLKGFASLEDKITAKVMGRFGEVGREIKQLRENGLREWEFDSTLLDPLKEQDEGIHGVVAEALKKGLKINSLNPEAMAPMIQDAVATATKQIHDQTQTQLLEALVPDAYELSTKPEFEAFLKDQPDAVIQAFIAWDDEKQVGVRNAGTLIAAYQAFNAHVAKDQKEADANADALQRATVEKGSGGGGLGRAVVTEEEAFHARLAELNPTPT